MKKTLKLLVIGAFSACLMGLGYGQSAAAYPVISSMEPSAWSTAALAPIAQSAAVLATALVCVLFGLLAIAPLLLDERGQ